MRFRAASLVRFAVVGSVLCVLFLIFGISFADQREPGWLEQGVALRIVNHLEDRLEMTVDQRTQAASILQRERPVMRAIVDRTRQEREELAAMRNFDESRTREILERYDEDDRSVQRERRRIRAELRAVLTEEQRVRMDSIRGRFGEEFVDRIGRFAEIL